MNKRGVNMLESWPEFFSFVLLIIGFIVSLLAGSKVMSYLIIALFGLMFGRLWHRHKDNFRFTWFLIILGFLIGYLLGNIYGSYITTIFLFLFGMWMSNYLQDKVKSVDY